MKNLTSIAEHSKWLGTKFEDVETKWKLHCKRIIFGEQPLEKWMFVPCDKDGNVIPDKENHFTRKELQEYQQAKERCLFVGFELKEIAFNSESIKTICLHEFLNVFWWHKKENKWELSKGISTIEDLVKYNIQLTPTAIKQLSL